MNRMPAWMMIAGWTVVVAMGQSVNEITALAPTSAVQGAYGLSISFTLDSDHPPAPPSGVLPDSVTLGGLSGASVAHPAQYTVTAVFDIPADQALGSYDASIVFSTPNGTLNYSRPFAFTVTSAASSPPLLTSHPISLTVQAGGTASFTVGASGAEPMTWQWWQDDTPLNGGTGATHAVAAVDASDIGAYWCVVSNAYGVATSQVAVLALAAEPPCSGYNLFAPLNATNTYLVNNDGATVHTWTSGYRPGNAVYLLEDGTLLRTANTGGTNFNTGGAGGRVERLDWAGNLVWAFDYSTPDHRLHHDIEPLPNGHVLMIAWEHKSEAEALAAGRDPALLTGTGLWPDTIIEVAPTGAYGGEVVWVWRVWDHLVQDYDAGQAHYGVVSDHPERIDLNFASSGAADWNHVNAVDYNEALDQIVLSVRAFSEIWIIDHGTTTEEAAGPAGDLLYRWGHPQAYGAGDAGDQQLFVQHDAQWIPENHPGAGHILVFNNGQGRPGGPYSSVDEIVPPLAPDGSYSNHWSSTPASSAWSYVADTPADFYAMNISGAQRLPDGHTLICDGPTGRFFEVTADGRTIWDYEAGGSVFRVTRYAYDYEGFAGAGLNPGWYPDRPYAIVDTAQVDCFDNTNVIAGPMPGAAFAGQDAQYAGFAIDYTISADGRTVDDNVTGLTWTRSPDLNDDGTIDADDKLTVTGAPVYVETLNATGFGGYRDWRVPTIKELYSLMNFSGRDMSGPDPLVLKPFIDTNAFAFGYGDTNAGDRLIDAQFVTSTRYVDTTMGGAQTMFGLNLADGRIKGYPVDGKRYYAYFVRGNTNYGVNAFVDNGGGTVTDQATGLIWQQADSGTGLNWQDALAYAEGLQLAGYRDWRLPNAKELQSLLDYTRAPGVTGTAAIDPVFTCTAMTNEAGQTDYPWYWTGTTHANISATPGKYAAYVCFGRAYGYMGAGWQDVHGAGCQRSDPKSGNLSEWTYTPHGYYDANAPQGDAIRILNHVRCVRGGATAPTNDVDADGLSDWYEYNYAGHATGLSPAGDEDHDGYENASECGAGTSPVDASSLLAIEAMRVSGDRAQIVVWPSVLGKTYCLEQATHLSTGVFTVMASGVSATPPINTQQVEEAQAEVLFYRVRVE